MNEWQVQKELRADFEQVQKALRADNLSADDYFSRVIEYAVTMRHPVTGQTFCELAAEHYAWILKRNRHAMARIKRIAPRFPGLAEQLLTYFPDDEDLKNIAEGWDTPPKPRDEHRYRDDAFATNTRKRGYVFNPVMRAELSAPRIAYGEDNPAEWHLREEYIDALVTSLCLFASPDAVAACPVSA